MRKHINRLREFSIPLVLGVVTALFWANMNKTSYLHCIGQNLVAGCSLHFITNDLFMVLFFGIAAAEITKSTLPGGDLNPLKKAANPLLATAGGVLGPIAVYLLLNRLLGMPQLQRGWGIPTATDIALAWLGARAVFGARHPAVSFLLLLAVADDAIGLAIITIFYPDPHQPFTPVWLLATAAGMLIAWSLRRLHVHSYWPYLLLGGGLAWLGLSKAHLHPALALVFIIPFLPATTRTNQRLFEETTLKCSALDAFGNDWKATVDIGLFMFGLTNAGVTFSTVGITTWLVLASLLVGKTIGIYSFGQLGRLAGFKLPTGMRHRDLLVAGMVAGTGFTVALFVAGEAFTDPLLQGAAKMGAMFSISASLVGFFAAWSLRIHRMP